MNGFAKLPEFIGPSEPFLCRLPALLGKLIGLRCELRPQQIDFCLQRDALVLQLAESCTAISIELAGCGTIFCGQKCRRNVASVDRDQAPIIASAARAASLAERRDRSASSSCQAASISSSNSDTNCSISSYPARNAPSEPRIGRQSTGGIAGALICGIASESAEHVDVVDGIYTRMVRGSKICVGRPLLPLASRSPGTAQAPTV